MQRGHDCVSAPSLRTLVHALGGYGRRTSDGEPPPLAELSRASFMRRTMHLQLCEEGKHN